MLSVSDHAATVLRTILEDSETEEGMCFRLIPKEEPGKYGFSFVEIRSAEDDDYYFQSEGHTVLLVGKEESEQLSGMKLDVVQNDKGKSTLAIVVS